MCRQFIAAAGMNHPDLAIKQIWILFKDDFVQCERDGIAPARLQALAKALKEHLQLSTQDVEGVNSIITRIAAICPRITLPLLSARVMTTKLLKLGSKQANSKVKWSAIRPRAISLLHKCLPFFNGRVGILDNPSRWSSPTPLPGVGAAAAIQEPAADAAAPLEDTVAPASPPVGRLVPAHAEPEDLVLVEASSQDDQSSSMLPPGSFNAIFQSPATIDMWAKAWQIQLHRLISQLGPQPMLKVCFFFCKPEAGATCYLPICRKYTNWQVVACQTAEGDLQGLGSGEVHLQIPTASELRVHTVFDLFASLKSQLHTEGCEPIDVYRCDLTWFLKKSSACNQVCQAQALITPPYRLEPLAKTAKKGNKKRKSEDADDDADAEASSSAAVPSAAASGSGDSGASSGASTKNGYVGNYFTVSKALPKSLCAQLQRLRRKASQNTKRDADNADDTGLDEQDENDLLEELAQNLAEGDKTLGEPCDESDNQADHTGSGCDQSDSDCPEPDFGDDDHDHNDHGHDHDDDHDNDHDHGSGHDLKSDHLTASDRDQLLRVVALRRWAPCAELGFVSLQKCVSALGDLQIGEGRNISMLVANSPLDDLGEPGPFLVNWDSMSLGGAQAAMRGRLVRVDDDYGIIADLPALIKRLPWLSYPNVELIHPACGRVEKVRAKDRPRLDPTAVQLHKMASAVLTCRSTHAVLSVAQGLEGMSFSLHNCELCSSSSIEEVHQCGICLMNWHESCAELLADMVTPEWATLQTIPAVPSDNLPKLWQPHPVLNVDNNLVTVDPVCKPCRKFLQICSLAALWQLILWSPAP